MTDEAKPKSPAGRARSAKYGASLEDLEASARVRVEDQVIEVPEPPSQNPLSDGEVDRQTFLRIAGAP